MIVKFFLMENKEEPSDIQPTPRLYLPNGIVSVRADLFARQIKVSRGESLQFDAIQVLVPFLSTICKQERGGGRVSCMQHKHSYRISILLTLQGREHQASLLISHLQNPRSP